MCGTVFPIFVHIAASPDIDMSADALYNQSKKVFFIGGILNVA